MKYRTISLIATLLLITAGCRQAEVGNETNDDTTTSELETETLAATQTPATESIDPDLSETQAEPNQQQPTVEVTVSGTEPTTAAESQVIATDIPSTAVPTVAQSIAIEFQDAFCQAAIDDGSIQQIFGLSTVERTVTMFEQNGSITLCQYRLSNNASANYAARLFQTPSAARAYYDFERATATSMNGVQTLDGTWEAGFFNPGTVTVHFYRGTSYGVVEYVTDEQIDLGPPLYAFAQQVASNTE